MKKSFLISLLLLVSVAFPVAAAPKNTDSEEAEFSRSAPEMGLYEDWKSVHNRKIDKTFGIIRIRVLPTKGTFNIGVINDNNKTIPVLSNMNEYTSSYFSLKVGKKIYKLVEGGDVKSKARATDDKVQIIYSVNKMADVLVEFIPEESTPGEGYDILRVQTTVTNTGKKVNETAIKNVMDTVLGEADLYHFYTSEDLPVKNEISLRSMTNAKYFNSRNSAAWCQFMLYGADITTTDIVALTNISSADSSSWEPSVASNRTFDSVTAYNNSAIQILWPTVRLLRGQSMENRYYIAFAADGYMPKGPDFIEAKSEKAVARKPKKVPSSAGKVSETSKVPADIVTVKIEPDYDKEDDQVSVVDKNGEQISIPKELLTPDYIQSLLDRIEALESTNATHNQAELKMLNDELDFILSIMRS